MEDAKSSISSGKLAPGFRFHPTDEELVRYYLRRKVCGKKFLVDAISEIDIYKAEPWDLPSMSKMKTRDLEWYFFSILDKKYGNGARTNRATEKGYWKTTGKDRAVHHRELIVGMKKTLVYHQGRAPKGQRSNWVMHEYRLSDLELERIATYQEAFVICRVFQKSGSGPKNGEQYGAPFLEEEWENDDSEPNRVSGIVLNSDLYLDCSDLEQILGSDYANSYMIPSVSNFQSQEGIYIDETTVDKTLDDMQMNGNLIKQDLVGESSKSGNSENVAYLLDEPFLDSFDYLPFDEGYIEANDLAYLIDDNSPDLGFDPFMILANEDRTLDQIIGSHQEPDAGTEKTITPSKTIVENGSIEDKYSLGTGFIKRASQMLGNIPAPPASAAEFPTKEAYLSFNTISPSATIQIQNSKPHKHGVAPVNGNHVVYSFIFSHGSDGSANLESRISLNPGKFISTISRDWLCFMFLCVVILCTSFKLGAYVSGN